MDENPGGVIQQLFDTCVGDIHAHHPMVGYRSIRDSLAVKYGLLVGNSSVWKVLKRLNIHGYTKETQKEPG